MTVDPKAAEVEGLAEQIARIIDPSSWAVFDGYLAQVKRKYRGISAGYDPAQFKDKASMAKAREILAALEAQFSTPRNEWQRIESAPRDGTLILVFAPGTSAKWEGDLGNLISLCAWHESAGFCICELREPTHWQPLPAPPAVEDEGSGDEAK
jgi:hypothetical protein